MMGAWWSKYRLAKNPFPMGDEDTYSDSLKWLDLPGVSIEDWGGGLGYAEQFVSQALTYKSVDGSSILNPVDLVTYQSETDCILIRHVLEHNPNHWDQILRNAMASFTQRMAIVSFCSFTCTNQVILDHSGNKPAWDTYRLPLPSILSLLSGTEVHMRTYDSMESIIFVEKIR